MRIIYIGGVPAAGKTTITKKTSQQLNEKNIAFIEGTNLLKEVFREEYEIDLSKSEVERMGIKDKAPLVKLAWKHMLNLNFNIVVLDGCYVQKRDGVYYQMLPEEFLPKVNSFVLIESDPNTIYQRRLQDKIIMPNRIFDKDEIPVEIRWEREKAEELSAKAKKPLEIIVNIDLDESVKKLLRLVAG